MMKRIGLLCLISFILLSFSAFVLPDEAEARKGMRMPSNRALGISKSRMKTYRFNNKTIYGYRNFIRERRSAKLASGGFIMRRDGSVVPRTFSPRLSRFRTIPLDVKPAPARTQPLVQGGQCRDGLTLNGPHIDWGCRHYGGVGWSHQPARIQGIRNY